MTGEKVYMFANQATPAKPVVFDEGVCNGCNMCVEICSADVLVPNQEKGKAPIVLYPEECWYGGCCVEMCPLRFQGAVKLVQPVMQKVRWKRKQTGEHFRIGMPNPPAPNTRPPVGGWRPEA